MCVAVGKIVTEDETVSREIDHDQHLFAKDVIHCIKEDRKVTDSHIINRKEVAVFDKVVRDCVVIADDHKEHQRGDQDAVKRVFDIKISIY